MNRSFTEEELRRLYKILRDSTNPMALRDLAWMQLLQETSIRVGELAKVKRHEAERWLRAGFYDLPEGQGKQPARDQATADDFQLTRIAIDALEYLLRVGQEQILRAGKTPGADAALIVGGAGIGISITDIQYRLRSWSSDAGIYAPVNAHMFFRAKPAAQLEEASV
ncbi:Tyrosine recombinase XerC [Andreprevotia sp. IGB-42]|uniref:hypothetical protein n=1 Tax=Andreprevotia sp. IGB-42 TaxID=2497473 RepID=UPI0013590CA8|nr:hypothetical protein [Andreprevotia sp. IGB-42]KAF0812773.1 Tyrosine recombinase XerC [Andreprevotia sp. IGB-42]